MTNDFVSTGTFIKSAQIFRRQSLLAYSILAVIVFRLWLTEAHDLMATFTPHDDYLFVLLAENILSGEWLGEFTNKTLIKGPVYPLFIALAHILSFPTLLAQQLLYSIACLTALSAIRPMISNKILLFLFFVILLFNPFMYNYPCPGRLFRLGLSVPLLVLLLSFMLGMITRLNRGFTTNLLWSLGTGISFALLWHTREEGIWMLPFVLLFIVLYFLIERKDDILSRKTRICLIILPVAIFIGTTALFGYLNYKTYGKFVVNELKSKEFTSAYGGLMNINEKKHVRQTPVPMDVIYQAIEYSPTLKELKPFFDKDHGRNWIPSFFIWDIREKTTDAGYYKDLPSTLEFYRKIGAEIEEACKNGNLECLDRSPSLRPPWRAEYNSLILPTLLQLYKTSINFTDFSTDIRQFNMWGSRGATQVDIIPAYKYVTKETILTMHQQVLDIIPDYVTHLKTEKGRILHDIGKAYKTLVKYLLWLAIVLHLYLMIRSFISKKLSFEIIFGLALLGGYFSILAMLTFVEITLWAVTRPLYAAYPMILFYIGFMFISFARDFRGAQDINNSQTPHHNSHESVSRI